MVKILIYRDILFILKYRDVLFIAKIKSVSTKHFSGCFHQLTKKIFDIKSN